MKITLMFLLMIASFVNANAQSKAVVSLKDFREYSQKKLQEAFPASLVKNLDGRIYFLDGASNIDVQGGIQDQAKIIYVLNSSMSIIPGQKHQAAYVMTLSGMQYSALTTLSNDNKDIQLFGYDGFQAGFKQRREPKTQEQMANLVLAMKNKFSNCKSGLIIKTGPLVSQCPDMKTAVEAMQFVNSGAAPAVEWIDLLSEKWLMPVDFAGLLYLGTGKQDLRVDLDEKRIVTRRLKEMGGIFDTESALPPFIP